MPLLIALSGLPGVGKSAVARILCGRLPAVYLRVDDVEAALKRSSLQIHPAEDAGYMALAAIAESNLRLGKNVVADTVNPVTASRGLWADTARSGNAQLLNVEIVCSDKAEHQRRVENRPGDIDGLILPSWQQVLARPYDAWTQPCLRLDSATLTASEAADAILLELPDEEARS